MADAMSTNHVVRLQALPAALRPLAGGKGSTLAQLLQAGYPVPDGFVILPTAFADGELTPTAWQQVETALHALRKQEIHAPVAVRSSALQEDSAQASFAGEFESVLNVTDDQALLAAIAQVYQSAQSARVHAYSTAHGLDTAHQIAIIVQRMVPAELAGVLFTADPVTGSYSHMLGNYVHGLGEQLVSGEANAATFRLQRPQGRYAGPDAFKPYAAKLYHYARKLETLLGGPQDIEWAVAGGKLYLLQARAITTLSLGNLETYDINESLVEDALWVNTNVAEAVPDVFSPLTWSIIREFDNELNFIPGYYVWSGNIYGRVYSNISRRVSAAQVLTGWDTKRILGLLGDIFGRAPAEMQIPLHPFSRWDVIKEMLPRIGRMIGKMMRARRQLPQFLQDTPAWCQQMTTRIGQIQTKAELLALWQTELQPYTIRAWWSHSTGATGVVNIMTLERKLTKLVGTEDASTLLSNLRRDAGLASLGPILGIASVIKGEMSRAEYLLQYGHRGPHEFELSIPHPAEDTTWLDKQIAEFERTQIDVAGLLARQQAEHTAAMQRFQARYPRKRQWLETQMTKVAAGASRRERSRSEFTRVFRVVRALALKAGELTGLGEDIFLLYVDDLVALLAGNAAAVRHIPARKANYEKYKTLPQFPSLIRGRFDPLAWAKDPKRRVDYYDPMMPIEAAAGEMLRGYPGAAGRVEGIVRILTRPEAGETLQPGEILVAATTNVGWTPLFPKALAIITDVGAPLSHAAIVARELGIPAVVGCGNATTRLKTGDRVLVDGGQGVVQILDQSAPEQVE